MTPTSIKQKTIGIIGGSTDLATAEYYKFINSRIREELGGLHTGEIIINSMDCAFGTHYVQNDLWEEGAKYINVKAKSLERAGADFILCVSNTWHRMCEGPSGWMNDVKIPLLHIADPTAQAIKDIGISNVALLGTKATTSSDYLRNYFHSKHGIAVIVPSEEQQDYINNNIFTELVHGKFTDKARKVYLDIIDELVQKGARGAILGCTEIPLLVSQKNRPDCPMFDTLRLHAEAAALMALDA